MIVDYDGKPAFPERGLAGKDSIHSESPGNSECSSIATETGCDSFPFTPIMIRHTDDRQITVTNCLPQRRDRSIAQTRRRRTSRYFSGNSFSSISSSCVPPARRV